MAYPIVSDPMDCYLFRNTVCWITLNGGRRKATYLGHGAYSWAYRIGNNVYLFTANNDEAKDFMGKMPRNPHLPRVKVVEKDRRYSVYKMPYYENPQPHTEAYDLAQKLDRLYRLGRNADGNDGVIYYVESDLTIPREIVKAIKTIYRKMKKERGVHGWWFDMHDQNFGVRDGRLILRDPIVV